MSRTIYDEAYGVGVDVAISANYRMRATTALNGVRFYCLRPSVGGLVVFLPIAGLAIPQWERVDIANHGAHSLEVQDALSNVIATVAAGTRESFRLVSLLPTLAGTWVSRNTASTVGATLVHDRVSLSAQFGSWAGTGVNLRTYCEQALGYDGSKPASVYCVVGSGVVIGSESTDTSQPAFDTGVWPAGSTVLLELQAGAQIVGRGGSGGSGGDVPPGLLAADGQPGGDALLVQVDTALVNHGVISGGGGGGGGGSRVGNGGGGGGGGGAGYQPSLGGAGGAGKVSPPGPAGIAGTAGAIGVGGAGGAAGSSAFELGGAGGGPGANGSNATVGAAGGAAGAATKRLSAVSLNLIVAGTINGPQVVV